MSSGELPPDMMPTLKSWVTPNSGLVTGDLVTVHIELMARSGIDIAIPEQSFAPFELSDRRLKLAPKEGKQHFVYELDLLALEPGKLTVPALSVRVVGIKGELAELKTAPATVEVASLLANEPNAQAKGPTQPVAVMQDDYTLAWVIGGVLTVGLIIALTVLIQRWLARRPKPALPPAPPTPPWFVALEQLEQLARRKQSMLESGRGEELVAELSNVIREYLGKRYGFEGLESTTDEVLTHLERLRPYKISLSSVQLLLAQCDLVKFARMPPTVEESDQIFVDVERIVRSTMPVASSAQAPQGASA